MSTIWEKKVFRILYLTVSNIPILIFKQSENKIRISFSMLDARQMLAHIQIEKYTHFEILFVLRIFFVSNGSNIK